MDYWSQIFGGFDPGSMPGVGDMNMLDPNALTPGGAQGMEPPVPTPGAFVQGKGDLYRPAPPVQMASAGLPPQITQGFRPPLPEQALAFGGPGDQGPSPIGAQALDPLTGAPLPGGVVGQPRVAAAPPVPAPGSPQPPPTPPVATPAPRPTTLGGALEGGGGTPGEPLDIRSTAQQQGQGGGGGGTKESDQSKTDKIAKALAGLQAMKPADRVVKPQTPAAPFQPQFRGVQGGQTQALQQLALARLMQPAAIRPTLGAVLSGRYMNT